VSASSSASWWAWPEGWPRTPRGIARRVLAEFIGTALPLAAIVGSGIAADRLSPGDAGVQLLINAAVTGAALVAILLAVGPVSGAHLSPVVTLADRAFGGVSRGLTAAYVAAQFAGAGAGVMLATLALPATDLSSTKRLDRGLWLGEAVATFGLVLVAFGIVRSRRTQLARRICAASYRKARPDVRKMSNRRSSDRSAFGTARSPTSRTRKPFASLLGSHNGSIVETSGLEPPTPCLQSTAWSTL